MLGTFAFRQMLRYCVKLFALAVKNEFFSTCVSSEILTKMKCMLFDATFDFVQLLH
jgi:hypothetical protein